MTDEDFVSKLKKMGGSEWVAGERLRVYFNAKNLLQRLTESGLEVTL